MSLKQAMTMVDNEIFSREHVNLERHWSISSQIVLLPVLPDAAVVPGVDPGHQTGQPRLSLASLP